MSNLGFFGTGYHYKREIIYATQIRLTSSVPWLTYATPLRPTQLEHMDRLVSLIHKYVQPGIL